MINEKIILASASPRRRELLSVIGIDFEVMVSDTDESIIDLSIPVDIYVQELALLKASAVCDTLLKSGRKNTIIISADTVVYQDGEILGKPTDEESAYNMLKKLSGKEHEVYTGICVMRVRDGFMVCDSRKTTVTFKELSDEKIKAYIKTGEPMDKAGSYGIQGFGSTLISGINGDYFNVVGLPIEALSTVLEKDFEMIIF